MDKFKTACLLHASLSAAGVRCSWRNQEKCSIVPNLETSHNLQGFRACDHWWRIWLVTIVFWTTRCHWGCSIYGTRSGFLPMQIALGKESGSPPGTQNRTASLWCRTSSSLRSPCTTPDPTPYPPPPAWPAAWPRHWHNTRFFFLQNGIEQLGRQLGVYRLWWNSWNLSGPSQRCGLRCTNIVNKRCVQKWCSSFSSNCNLKVSVINMFLKTYWPEIQNSELPYPVDMPWQRNCCSVWRRVDWCCARSMECFIFHAQCLQDTGRLPWHVCFQCVRYLWFKNREASRRSCKQTSSQTVF